LHPGSTAALLLFRSDDGGAHFAPLPTTAFAPLTQNSTLELDAVSPSDPDVVFARVSSETETPSDGVYRSTDGGGPGARGVTAPEPAFAAIRANGDVVVGTFAHGIYVSTDGGDHFAPADAPHLRCLADAPDGRLWGCGDPSDAHNTALAATSDEAQWETVL